MGYSAYFSQSSNESVLESAVRAADWIHSCQDQTGAWNKGYSKAVSGGNLTFNTMVSWGLSELYSVSKIERFKEMALKSAYYYAGFIDKDGWPDHSGLDDGKDRLKPLTHTIGYTFAGIYQTGVLLEEQHLKDIAIRMSSGLAKTVKNDGFIPGRIGPGFRSRARWACLTGSAQIAYVWLKMVLDGTGDIGLFYKALTVLEYIRSSQRINTANQGIDYAIAGSFPFSPRGYCRVTYPNWAAKFTIDCFHLLYELSKVEPYRGILEPYGIKYEK